MRNRKVFELYTVDGKSGLFESLGVGCCVCLLCESVSGDLVLKIICLNEVLRIGADIQILEVRPIQHLCWTVLFLAFRFGDARSVNRRALA